MLGVFYARPRPFLLTSLSLSYAHRLVRTPLQLYLSAADRIGHSNSCQAKCCTTGTASIWHAILPSVRRQRKASSLFNESGKKGEGSWNVAWDARPARWLHHKDSAWMLFGVCACLTSTILMLPEDSKDHVVEVNSDCEAAAEAYNYRVTGVAADGRCLFRAVAHMACLRNGEEVPDEDRQTELADELREKVVEELLKRRKEIEWCIEEDFEFYVKRIEQTYTWGGEPELLMSSHVLRKPISVYMKDQSSGGLTNIANYGEEYKKDDEIPITVLFYGYGHYDILETTSDSCLKVETTVVDSLNILFG